MLRRAFLALMDVWPKGSLQRAWIVSPPMSLAAELEGAHLRTESGPQK